MSDKDTPENSETPNGAPLKSKPNKRTKTILGLAIAVALVGGAVVFASKNDLLPSGNKAEYATAKDFKNLERRIDTRLGNIQTSISTLVEEKINEVSSQEGFGALNKLQKQQIANEIIRTIDVDTRVSVALEKSKDKIVISASNKARDDIEKDISSLINESIETFLAPYSQFNSTQVVKNEEQDTRLTELNVAISEMHTMISSRKKAISIPEQTRTRLHGFSVLHEMADGVFAIQAPDRTDGRAHYVTLYNGEPFVSVLGRHKVTDIKGKGKDAVLLVGSKFYIDDDRVEYTPQQLAQIRKNKQKRAVKKTTQQQQERQLAKNNRHATTASKTTVDHIGKLPKQVVKPQTAGLPIVVANTSSNAPSDRSASVQYLNGRILLPDWAMVVKSPTLDSALVVNLNKTEGEKVRSVEKGQYYDFIGTVKEITADGTVCSDTYCIGSLQ